MRGIVIGGLLLLAGCGDPNYQEPKTVVFPVVDAGTDRNNQEVQNADAAR